MMKTDSRKLVCGLPVLSDGCNSHCLLILCGGRTVPLILSIQTVTWLRGLGMRIVSPAVVLVSVAPLPFLPPLWPRPLPLYAPPPANTRQRLLLYCVLELSDSSRRDKRKSVHTHCPTRLTTHAQTTHTT